MRVFFYAARQQNFPTFFKSLRVQASTRPYCTVHWDLPRKKGEVFPLSAWGSPPLWPPPCSASTHWSSPRSPWSSSLSRWSLSWPRWAAPTSTCARWPAFWSRWTAPPPGVPVVEIGPIPHIQPPSRRPLVRTAGTTGPSILTSNTTRWRRSGPVSLIKFRRRRQWSGANGTLRRARCTRGCWGRAWRMGRRGRGGWWSEISPDWRQVHLRRFSCANHQVEQKNLMKKQKSTTITEITKKNVILWSMKNEKNEKNEKNWKIKWKIKFKNFLKMKKNEKKWKKMKKNGK